MAFDPTSAVPFGEEQQPQAKGGFDPQSAKIVDSTPEAKKELTPIEKGLGTVVEKGLEFKEGFKNVFSVNTALDVVDMAVGFFTGMIPRTLEAGAAIISDAPKGFKDTLKNVSEWQAAEDLTTSGKIAMAPIRGFRESVLGQKVPQTPVTELMGKFGEGLSERSKEAGTATGIEELQYGGPLLVNALMAYFGARAGIKASTEVPKEHLDLAQKTMAEHSGTSIRNELASGATEAQVVQRILDTAKKSGIDTSSFTKEQVVEAVKMRANEPKVTPQEAMQAQAEAYGVTTEPDGALARYTRKEAGVLGDRRSLFEPPMGKEIREKVAKVDEMLGMKPFVERRGAVQQTMSTDLLASIRDKNRRAEPETTVEAPGGIEEVKSSIQKKGITQPVTVTISTLDNMAYVTDGNTRVSAASELGLKDVPVKFEKTDVPFTEGQKAKARPLDELGLDQSKIPYADKTKQQLIDKQELSKLLEQPAKLTAFHKKQGGWIQNFEPQRKPSDKIVSPEARAEISRLQHVMTQESIAKWDQYKINPPDFFRKQAGAVDKGALIASGLVLGGATLGALLEPNDTTLGLAAGAAFGLGLATLPKAMGAISKNWTGALKTGATGLAYAGVGAYVDKESPIEGIIVGSALFGTRFAPKVKFHPEDQLINAMNGNISALKRISAQTEWAMKKSLNDAQLTELSSLVENPKFVGRTPEERAVVEAHRSLTKSYYESAQATPGIKMGFIEGYVAHIVESAGKSNTEVQRILGQLFQDTGGVGGKAKFTKERMYPTFESLEKALEGTDLQIKTKNLAEIDRIYMDTMNRTIERQKLINNLKEATLPNGTGAKSNLITTEPISGYARLPNPQLLPYHVHPDIVPALKFVFDARTHDSFANGLINLNRAIKRVNVVGSYFHAKSLLEAYSLLGGNLLTAKGAIASALRQFKEGGLGDELDAGLKAGLRVDIPEEISAKALESVGQLVDLGVNRVFGTKTKIGEKIGGKIEGVQEKIFDKFTWDYLHTGLKIASYLRLMEDYHSGAKGKGVDINTYRQGVASHINDTFGGLDWYRVVTEAKTEAGRKLAMSILKPSARDWLGIGIFAPDWTASTLRAMSKALPGGAKNPTNAVLAQQYALRTAITYAIAINSMNYAISGHFLWDNKDPLKLDNGDGTQTQLVKHSAEFGEWVREPVKTFSNKMGFVPRAALSTITGQQYAMGPKIEGSKLAFVAKGASPFFARGFTGDVDPATGAMRSLISIMGITVTGKTEEEKRYAREQRAARKEKKMQEE